jgi:hypothetical protein
VAPAGPHAEPLQREFEEPQGHGRVQRQKRGCRD